MTPQHSMPPWAASKKRAVDPMFKKAADGKASMQLMRTADMASQALIEKEWKGEEAWA